MSTEDLVLVIAERDYLYGTGSLTLRVEYVEQDAPVPYNDEDWYYVHGTQLGQHGRELGTRTVVVRGRRLTAAGLRLE